MCSSRGSRQSNNMNVICFLSYWILSVRYVLYFYQAEESEIEEKLKELQFVVDAADSEFTRLKKIYNIC